MKEYPTRARRQIHQIRRRVLLCAQIPHDEKVFSIFEPHTEWISNGKAGVPVELGLRVCIVEDQNRFILHHRVMEKETDEGVALEMVQQTKLRYIGLTSISYDKGFHSKANQINLKTEVPMIVLPRKGKLSIESRKEEGTTEFIRLRRMHSAVESAINALEVHGLDRCPDHGLVGLKRYVALAVLARNVHRLGVVLKESTESSHKTPDRLAA